MALPGGVVSFLFSDIEGSTALWEADPDSMREALKKHDDVVAAVVSGANGSVFKHTGDGFAAVFETPSEALTAARDYERALRSTKLRARVGVHTGEAHPRDDDYFGPDVNRAARVMDAANGGQIVVSESTYAVAHHRAPEGSFLVDAGEHRLKDLGEPVRLYRLVWGDDEDRRALRTLDAVPHNLPVQLSSFVGRSAETAEVAGLVMQHRLTTLTGAGGVGKTRLSLQVGAELLQAFSGGVWFLELAAVTEPDLIPESAVTSLQIRPSLTRPALEHLIDSLTSKELLLIIDNCEHLIDDVALFVDELLRRAPLLRVLATSREGLATSGERLWRVPSLSSGGEASAVQLFEERARLVRSDFTVDEDNLDAVVAICERLDGVPLAIELATARLKMLTVDQIGERLADRFGLLTGGDRTTVERQRTLLATMDWSYDLLSDREQALLRRLAVFTGGFSLEAAEEVASGGDLRGSEVLDPLGRLVETSLVTFDEGPTPRYHLLETVRQYSLDKLLVAGEDYEAHRRHTDYFGSVAEQISTGLLRTDSSEVSQIANRELPNMRAAMAWAYGAGETELGLRIAVGLRQHFFNTVSLVESLRWTYAGVGQTQAFRSTYQVRALAYSLTVAGNLFEEALVAELLAKAKAVLATDIDLADRAALLGSVAAEYEASDPARADQLYQDAVEAYRRAGSPRWVGPQYNRFLLLFITGAAQDARLILAELRNAHVEGTAGYPNPDILEALVDVYDDRAEEALAKLAAIDVSTSIDHYFYYGCLIDAYIGLGRIEDAGEAVETYWALGQIDDPREAGIEEAGGSEEGLSLATLHAASWEAGIAVRTGDLGAVVPAMRPMLKAAGSERALYWANVVAAQMATLAMLRGDPARSAQLFGYRDRWAAERGFKALPHDERMFAGAADTARSALGDEEYDRLAAMGAATMYGDLPLYDE